MNHVNGLFVVLWFAHFSWITRIKKLIHLDTGQPASGSKVPVFHQYGYLYDIISLDTGQPASGSKVSFFCQYGYLYETIKQWKELYPNEGILE